MSKYNIKIGTTGLLIIQETGVHVKTEPWTMRKNATYFEENLIVDPDEVANNPAAFPADWLATKLASEGYMIFSAVSNRDSKYMIAIQKDNVDIS